MISGRDKHFNNFITGVIQEMADGQNRQYFDDPTTMGFNIFFEFDSEFSPLLNQSDRGESAVRYLENIDEPERAEKLKEFIFRLKELVTVYPYFIESLSGLENTYDIDAARGFEHERELVINTKESIDFRIGGMIEAYDFATFDTFNRRDMLPENMRNFRVVVIVSEIRKFRTFIKQLAQDATNPDEAVFPHTMKDISKNLATFVYIFDNCTLNYSASNSFAELNNLEPEQYTNTFSIKTGVMTTDHRVDFLDLVSNVGGNGDRADLKSTAIDTANDILQRQIAKFKNDVDNVFFRSSQLSDPNSLIQKAGNANAGTLNQAKALARGVANPINPVSISTTLAGRSGLSRGITNAIVVGSSDANSLGNKDLGNVSSQNPNELGSRDVGDKSENASELGNRDVGGKSENASELGSRDVGGLSENSQGLGSRDVGELSENSESLGTRDVGGRSENADNLGVRDVGDQSENATNLGIRDVGNQSGNADDLGTRDVGDQSGNADGLGEINVGSNIPLTLSGGKATSLSTKDVGTISENGDNLGQVTLPSQSENGDDLGRVGLPNQSQNADDLGSTNVGELSENGDNLGQVNLPTQSDNTDDLGQVNLPNKSQNADDLGSTNVGGVSKNADDLGSTNVGELSENNTENLRRIPVGTKSKNAQQLGDVDAGSKSKNALKLGRQDVGQKSNEQLRPARLDLISKSNDRVDNLGKIQQDAPVDQRQNNLGKIELEEREEKGIKSLNTVYVGDMQDVDFTKLFMSNVFNYEKTPISSILMAFTASNLGRAFNKEIRPVRSSDAEYNEDGKISNLGQVVPLDKRNTNEEDC